MVDRRCVICGRRVAESFEYARMSGQEGRPFPPGWAEKGVCCPCGWFYSEQPGSVFDADLAESRRLDQLTGAAG